MNASRCRYWVMMSILCAAFPRQAAWADAEQAGPSAGAATSEEAGGLEEIVVTAQRRAQNLMEVPISISALTSKDLQNQGITETESLSSVVPNLQVNSGFGDAQPNFSLRGVSVGNEYDTNQVSPVGIYVDDEYLPFRSTHGMQLYDLDRIEVLKGPQGTLFGRNTTGGAINFITHAPSLTGEEGYMDVGYGRFNDVHAQGAAEYTPINGVLGIRAAVNYENAGGYVTNVFPGASDGNSKDSFSARLIVRFKPSDDLDMNLKLYGSGGDPTQAAVYQRGIGANLTNPVTGYSRQGLDFWTVDSFRSDHNYTRESGAVFTLRYDLAPRWSFTNLSSYGVAGLEFGQEGSGGPVSLLDTRYGSNFAWLNQELRLHYGGDRLDFQTGLYYGTDHNVTLNTYGFFFFAGPAVAESVVQHYIQTAGSTAVFAQADYKLTDHFTLTLGDRYTWDRSAYRNGNAYIGDINYQPVAYTVGTATTDLPNMKNSEGADTYRVALSYKTDDGQLVYASVNHGYRAGTYSGQGYFSPSQIYITKPETVEAYEVGYKGRFLDNRMQLTAAAFDYQYKDQQINNVVGAVGFLLNAGRSTIRGGEAELQEQVTRNFLARLSLAYLNARYDELSLSGSDLDGNQLPFAPHFTGNIGFDWTLGDVVGGKVMLSPTLSYTSKEFFSPFNEVANNGYLAQGSLALLAANLSWERDHFSARIWGTNLMNRENFTYGLNLQASFGYDYLLQGPPREYGVAFRYSF